MSGHSSLFGALAQGDTTSGALLGLDREKDMSHIQTMASSQPQEYRNFLNDMIYGPIETKDKLVRRKRYGGFEKYIPNDADVSIKTELDTAEKEIRTWINGGQKPADFPNTNEAKKLTPFLPSESALSNLSAGTAKKMVLEAYNTAFNAKKSMFNSAFPMTLALPSKSTNKEGYSLDQAFAEIMD